MSAPLPKYPQRHQFAGSKPDRCDGCGLSDRHWIHRGANTLVAADSHLPPKACRCGGGDGPTEIPGGAIHAPQLDAMQCACKCPALRMGPHCHPWAPFIVDYVYGSSTLNLRCSKCGVSALQIAVAA